MKPSRCHAFLLAIILPGIALQDIRAIEPRVVFVFGDSITAGSALPVAERAHVWVQLVEKQADGRLQMVNEGKGGRPTDSVQEFEAMLARRPHADMLVLALGTNDSRDISEQCVPKAVANLRAMAARAREAYGQRLAILVVGPPNIRKDALGPTRPIADERDARLRELGAAFAELARELRCDFVSLYGVVPDASLGRDGVHPDAAGNRAIADVMLPKLLSMTEATPQPAPYQSRAPEPATKHLLLDSRMIESTEGVALRLGRVTKHPANPLFREDQPWEVRFDNLYANVVFDETKGIYRCWYSPFIVDPAVTETPVAERATQRYRPHDREMGVCYAVSRDGLHWDKPALGLVEFAGGTQNNLVVRGPHGAGVLFDPVDLNAARRYKMFCRASDKVKTMAVAFSPDGLRWTERTLCPDINVPGDTHNNAFWCPQLRKYVGITRLKTDQRLVGRTESADFIHWTNAVEVVRGDVRHQTYAMPAFRYAGLYLGLVMIFDTASDRVWCELAWSPDTIVWQRIEPGRALIPNSEKPGDYDWGCVYAAAPPIFTEKEIRLYYGASNGPHTNWRDGFFALATLRPDGFAGYETTTSKQAGFVTTVPVTCTGRQLRVSADAAHGTLRVTVLDDERLGFGQCNAITTDVTEGVVTWTNGADLRNHIGRPIRLRFELTAAELYAFSFTN